MWILGSQLWSNSLRGVSLSDGCTARRTALSRLSRLILTLASHQEYAQHSRNMPPSTVLSQALHPGPNSGPPLSKRERLGTAATSLKRLVQDEWERAGSKDTQVRLHSALLLALSRSCAPLSL